MTVPTNQGLDWLITVVSLQAQSTDLKEQCAPMLLKKTYERLPNLAYQLLSDRLNEFDHEMKKVDFESFHKRHFGYHVPSNVQRILRCSCG